MVEEPKGHVREAILLDWSTLGDRLIGQAFGRKGFDDGATVMTSAVVDKGPGWVVTESGTLYRLGMPYRQVASYWASGDQRARLRDMGFNNTANVNLLTNEEAQRILQAYGQGA